MILKYIKLPEIKQGKNRAKAQTPKQAKRYSCEQGREQSKEEASISVFVSIVFLAILAVIGLINDGASIRNNRRRLADFTAQAARIAAQEIDLNRLRLEGEVGLDSARAKSIVEERVQDGFDMNDIEVEVNVLGDQVTVLANKRIELWGMRYLTITAQRTARVTTNFSSTQGYVP